MTYKHIIVSRLALALLGLALGFGLATCGTPAPGAAEQDRSTHEQVAAPTGPARPLDACALLTQADAEALLSAPVAPSSAEQFGGGEPQDERAVSHCYYHTTGADYKSVSVLIRRSVEGERARDGLQQIRDTNAIGGTFEPVGGLGEEAIWNHGGADEQLNVAQSQFLVIASADLGKGVPTLEISKAIAQRVLARLP
jgi:hypothetical protein